MSGHRSGRIDRQTAERLLRGEPAGPAGLVDLLAAAAATTRDGDLPGEQAAVSAFRAAHLGPVAQPRRPSVLNTLLTKLLTVKIAVAALAVATVGGVAVTAATGALPTVLHHASTTGFTTGHPASTTSEPPAASGGDRSGNAEGREGDSKDAEHSGTPSPSLVGLCHTYTAGAGSNPGKALDNPAFNALITAAGGKDKVPGYCGTVLSKATHDDHDGHKDSTGTHPAGAPTTNPAPAPGSPGQGVEHAPAPPTAHPSPEPAPGQGVEHAPAPHPGR